MRDSRFVSCYGRGVTFQSDDYAFRVIMSRTDGLDRRNIASETLKLGESHSMKISYYSIQLPCIDDVVKGRSWIPLPYGMALSFRSKLIHMIDGLGLCVPSCFLGSSTCISLQAQVWFGAVVHHVRAGFRSSFLPSFEALTNIASRSRSCIFVCRKINGFVYQVFEIRSKERSREVFELAKSRHCLLVT